MSDPAVDPAVAPNPPAAPPKPDAPDPAPQPSDPPNKDRPTNDPPANGGADWRASISDPKVKEFASRFTSPADAAKFALEARQKLSNAINIPGKDAKPEDVAEFRKKIGVPETPDGYEITVPDGVVSEEAKPLLEQGLADFRKHMHESGVPAAAAAAAAEWFFRDAARASAAAAKSAEEAVKEAESALRSEWGKDYEANLEFARREFKSADEEFRNLVQSAMYQGKPLGSHPAFLKAFARYGRMNNEGGAQFGMDETAKKDAEAQFDELTKKGLDAQMKGDYAAARRYFAERDEIGKKLFPSAA